jgi:urease accessory protein
VYRNGGGGRAAAGQRQVLAVAAGASLEWLPQETIVYQGAEVELETRVELAEGAAFLGWEILCLGRPAAGESFGRGRCRQRLELWRAGRPLCLERAVVDGGGRVLAAAWGLGGATVSATLLATGGGAAGRAGADDVAGPLRALAGALPAGDLASVTVIGDLLVCRYLGASAERARRHFLRAWQLLRPLFIGRPATAPRVWDHRPAGE